MSAPWHGAHRHRFPLESVLLLPPAPITSYRLESRRTGHGGRTQGPSSPRSPACKPNSANRASTAAWLGVVWPLVLIEDVLEELVAGEELLLLLVPVDPVEPDGT